MESKSYQVAVNTRHRKVKISAPPCSLSSVKCRRQCASNFQWWPLSLVPTVDRVEFLEEKKVSINCAQLLHKYDSNNVNFRIFAWSFLSSQYYIYVHYLYWSTGVATKIGVIRTTFAEIAVKKDRKKTTTFLYVKPKLSSLVNQSNEYLYKFILFVSIKTRK